MRNANMTLIGKPEETHHLADLGVDGRIMLKWILKQQDARVWTGFI
jgi:hypothetical protein